MAARDSDPTQVAPFPEAAAAAGSEFPAAMRVAGRYELLGLVGTGGMGSVYRARDTELGEVVALKVVRRELLRSPEMLERFRLEVALARKVTHPNVARTYDIGEHDGDRFLTMEFVEGESLGELLTRTGALEMSTALDIASEVCRGLEAAHRAGVIHLDLKPDNVLLAADGRVVIGDFGIARALGGGSTATNSPAGTPAYMAPEQVAGGELDEAADVYALGAILYELVTGSPAWEGPSPLAVAAARLLRPPPDPRLKRPDLPDALALLVLRCMAKEAGDRFASAEDVRGAIEGVKTLRPSSTLRAQPPLRLEASTKAVAVLPFRNRGAAEDDYLADGLTEEVIDAVGDSPAVSVRARGAVMAFKKTDRDPRDVGRVLGVDVVVEGAVRRANGLVHVNVRIVGVEDGYHLWTRRFDVREGQLLRVADEIAVAVARAVEAPCGARVAKAHDDVALDLFLRARYELNKGTPELTRGAIALLEEALTRLPNDPAILATYAQAQFRRFTYDAEDPTAEEAVAIAERAALRALELSPSLAEARVALANLRLSVGDGPGAAQELVHALRTSGGSSALVQDLYGRLLAEVGPVEEALLHLKRAIAIEPTLERARADILRLDALRGKWTSVSDAVDDAVEPRSVFWLLCARFALWHPDANWAAELLSRIARIDFPQRPLATDVLRVRLGQLDPEALMPLLAARGALRGKSVRRVLFFRQLTAEVWLSQGRVDQALSEIAAATDIGLMDVVWLDHCPLLIPLAANPRIVALRPIVAARASAVLEVLRTAPR